MSRDTPASRAQMREPHRAPGRAPDRRGRRQRLRPGQAQGRASGRRARLAQSADQRRDRGGPARLSDSCIRPTSIPSTCSVCAELALEMMRLLASFNPHLTGTGSVGKRRRTCGCASAAVHRRPEGFGDLPANQQIPFRVRETRMWSAIQRAVVPDLVDQYAGNRYSHHGASAGSSAPAPTLIAGGPAAGARTDRVGGNAGGRQLMCPEFRTAAAYCGSTNRPNPVTSRR